MSAVAERPIVYDVGMNAGEDIPYYVKKGYRVVGIEANPDLAQQVSEQYAPLIEGGDVTVLNVGVGPEPGRLPFYIHQNKSGLSSFVLPQDGRGTWRSVEVEVRRLSDVIAEHGTPAFVKIDVEGVDHEIVLELLSSGIRPPMLSVEVHRLDALCSVVAMGYQEMQFVNCSKIGQSGRSTPVRTLSGEVTEHSFPVHSAGPFGDDLTGQWLSAEAGVLEWFAKRLVLGSGWYDVHARYPAAEAVNGSDVRTVAPPMHASAAISEVARDALRRATKRRG
jgi:FkbM family methyltransferase